MTELSKYIGPDVDLPGMGEGINAAEIGYLYGQYKRINEHYGQFGKGLLWGGSPVYTQAQGYGVVYFAKKMLADKGMSFEGKKCLILGSHYVALAIAEKLIQLGAIPITFSDSSGFVYEAGGFDDAKLKTVQKIKADRGARIGRYIIASTSAEFNHEPASIFDIPCDFVIPCSRYLVVDEVAIAKLSSNGCTGIIEGVHHGFTNGGLLAARKRGMLHAPYRATTIGASLVNGMTIANNECMMQNESLDSYVENAMSDLYEEVNLLLIIYAL